MWHMSHLANVVGVVLAIAFTTAAISKLSTFGHFNATLRRWMPSLPIRMVTALAFSVPVLEFVLVVWLVGGWTRPVAFMAVAVVLLSFTLILLYFERNGHSVSNCNCFGTLIPPKWRTKRHIFRRNTVLTLTALLGAFGAASDPRQMSSYWMIGGLAAIVPLAAVWQRQLLRRKTPG